MPVRVATGFKKRIRENPGGIVVQVRDAADAGAAERALQRARAEIVNLDGGWQSAPGLERVDANGPTYVSAVLATPSGPMLYVDGGYTPAKLLTTIPDIVARRLTDADVAHALVAWPEQEGPGTYWLTDAWPRSVVLRFYPPAPRLTPGENWAKVASEWYGPAEEWVRAEPGGEPAWVIAGPAAFVIPDEQLPDQFVRLRRGGFVVIGKGDVEHLSRAAHATFIAHQTFALGGGGPDATDEQLLETVDALMAIARSLAGTLSYAHISIDPYSNALAQSYQPPGRRWPGGRPPSIYNPPAGPEAVHRVPDVLALDAFHYQILGPGHLERLGPTIHSESEFVRARPLDGGRVELTLGEVSSWLPDSPDRTEVETQARNLFAPCLVNSKEAREIADGRRARNILGGTG